jgi:hypothetical protein
MTHGTADVIPNQRGRTFICLRPTRLNIFHSQTSLWTPWLTRPDIVSQWTMRLWHNKNIILLFFHMHIWRLQNRRPSQQLNWRFSAVQHDNAYPIPHTQRIGRVWPGAPGTSQGPWSRSSQVANEHLDDDDGCLAHLDTEGAWARAHRVYDQIQQGKRETPIFPRASQNVATTALIMRTALNPRPMRESVFTRNYETCWKLQQYIKLKALWRGGIPRLVSCTSSQRVAPLGAPHTEHALARRRRHGAQAGTLPSTQLLRQEPQFPSSSRR